MLRNALTTNTGKATASVASAAAISRQNPSIGTEFSARLRFLIVSEGRTGSSLLAGILGEAGGNLGQPVETAWDPRFGANELPGIDAARRAVDAADFLAVASRHWPGSGLALRYYRSLSKRRVCRLLDQASILKFPVNAIPYIDRVGFTPRVIAVYRNMGDHARAKLLMHRTLYPEVVERLRDTYGNALLAIHTYGGCAISYEELTDPHQSDWIEAISQCTGLAVEDIAAARKRIARPRRLHVAPSFQLDERLDWLHAQLSALRGRYIPPSPQYLERRADGR